MQKEHSGQAKFRGWLHPILSAPEMDKIGENLRKQNGKERTWVVCSGDVKRMFIGSLADESGWKWMTALKGLNTYCTLNCNILILLA